MPIWTCSNKSHFSLFRSDKKKINTNNEMIMVSYTFLWFAKHDFLMKISHYMTSDFISQHHFHWRNRSTNQWSVKFEHHHPLGWGKKQLLFCSGTSQHPHPLDIPENTSCWSSTVQYKTYQVILYRGHFFNLKSGVVSFFISCVFSWDAKSHSIIVGTIFHVVHVPEHPRNYEKLTLKCCLVVSQCDAHGGKK